MMEWNEYISQLLSSSKDFENLIISIDGGKTKTEIPPIIQASVTMLDKMTAKQGQLNILVFPERIQSIFIFTLMKLFHNISAGKIQSSYDPTGFAPGEKLKVGNAVVEYLGTEERDGLLCVNIRLADMDKCSTPIKYLPIFQKVATNRKLSKWAKYVAERKALMAKIDIEVSGSENLTSIAAMKTHMDSSIFAMTSVASAKELLSRCTIGADKVTKLFYISQCDYEGNLSNISPGQMAGNPAIVFASDLYAINAAADNNHPIQSVIIDGSNTAILAGQLDALDDLIQLNIPIVCITDVANSFELEPFTARGFNIWRWDSDSLTSQLYDAVPLTSDRRTKNCAKQSVVYLKSDGSLISDAMKRLSAHRKETEDQSPQMMKLFEKLNGLTFNALRAIIPLSDIEVSLAQRTLEECEGLLESEIHYLNEGSVEDYLKIICNLKEIFVPGFTFKKSESVKNYLQEHNGENIILVIPERASKSQIQEYWYRWCLQHSVKSRVMVLYPSEYYNWPCTNYDTTVICGWLKRAIMRKIIYGFNTSKYVVLLYDYENRWKNHDARRWSKALNNSGNKTIIEKYFSTDTVPVSTERYVKQAVPELPETSDDELGEIELILRENKFRQYAGGSHTGSELVSAIPVNFVGGYLAFYRTGHKVVSATKIIMTDADKIDIKLPAELKIGDFVVVRETDRDLVREIADVALANSGKQNLREIASKWRDALQIELLFCTEDEFCEKVKSAGCTKGSPTIKRWIDDEDVIAPQSKEDLRILAAVTENETLLEMLDEIFEAAQEVRRAHILAGRKLSEQLKTMLVAELKKFEDIDPFNFWEPIDMDIEGIGNVKVLKIIDIGGELQVDSTDTNRLIEE